MSVAYAVFFKNTKSSDCVDSILDPPFWEKFFIEGITLKWAANADD